MTCSAYYSEINDKIVLITPFNWDSIGISYTDGLWHVMDIKVFINSDYVLLGSL